MNEKITKSMFNIINLWVTIGEERQEIVDSLICFGCDEEQFQYTLKAQILYRL